MGFWILSINSQNPAGTPRPYPDALPIDLAKYAISAVLAPHSKTDPGFVSSQEGPQPSVPMCQEILLDLISCGDTGKHTPDVGKNFAIKESHCKCHGAGSLTPVVG